jgi:hypothetical protein
MINNKISLDITSAQKTAVEDAKDALALAVKGFEIQVEKEEVKALPKISDGRIPFVEKVSQYAVTDPQFLPPFADVPEFTKDFQTFKDIREMVRPLRQILDNMENSMYVSGSESYLFALNYYKTVQFNAKMGVPGAQTILDDLRPLFEGKEPEPIPPTE